MNAPTSPLPNFAAGVLCDASDDRLLPAIAQDAESGRVLMLAWMNEEAWSETLQTGRAVYFSRSRGKLWRKGETSGHQQIVRSVQVDCDGDTILLHVDQTGAACHEGYASCFFRDVNSSGEVDIREPRLVDPADVYGSDTTTHVSR
ncbi:phosphoribosyl-AMP cyclohydrolase [Aporhodopirellula aestuarii]|uniref:Phosphoribosyl-AMP cyclohydrolase n=1 Tax=Aporhodopirellula aestuarii TaxID=2950107 RepID=A0ABT0U422_9BACT|nr:phosphoribosyl-AMP cyclohydrolase [Aporhodopirellula aestuarii]MCM2371628.1 phosphoribosyl-AMP cyclohydrolase [Aporhodopirellula aestuarii]